MEDVWEVLVSSRSSHRGATREKGAPSGRPRPGPGYRSTLMFLGVLTLTSCFDQVLIPDVETDGRLTVTNDEEALSERLTYVEVEIPIDPASPRALRSDRCTAHALHGEPDACRRARAT